jgi:enoyl-CoA hydratase/carnithine racemase
MSNDADVLVDREGDRVRMTLSRPEKANTMTGDTFVTLRETFEDLDGSGVDAVTIRGVEENFSAGVDVSDVPAWAEMNPLDVRDLLEPVHDAVRAVEALDAPVVAACEGYVLGGGLELALACDLRVAARSAEFGLPESKLGLAMDVGGAQKLPGMVGEGLTKYLIMTGESIDADRAHRAGLVEEVHDDPDFEAGLDALVDNLAAKPTYVHDLAKRQVHAARPLNLDEAMEQAIHHAIAAYHEEETLRRVGEFLEE